MNTLYQLSNNGITNNDLIFTDKQKDLLIYRMLYEGKEYVAKLMIGYIRYILDNPKAFNEFMQDEHFTYNYIICEYILKKIDGIGKTKKIIRSPTEDIGVQSNISEMDPIDVRNKLYDMLYTSIDSLPEQYTHSYKGIFMVPIKAISDNDFDVNELNLSELVV